MPDIHEVIPDTNTAHLHKRNNASFFKGTVVERAVAEELSRTAAICESGGT